MILLFTNHFQYFHLPPNLFSPPSKIIFTSPNPFHLQTHFHCQPSTTAGDPPRPPPDRSRASAAPARAQPLRAPRPGPPRPAPPLRAQLAQRAPSLLAQPAPPLRALRAPRSAAARPAPALLRPCAAGVSPAPPLRTSPLACATSDAARGQRRRCAPLLGQSPAADPPLLGHRVAVHRTPRRRCRSDPRRLLRSRWSPLASP
ncbi:hypothetical protein Syun_026314 [Stephania yunnanensis]|uniref:Uncharacterized protein n=1 Tax=Stephania yunnanensis TaxID=152371 RepID=A0AAP0HWB0_9MAGN